MTQKDAVRAIRPLWTQIYLPNLVIATGQGAMIPILVFAAREVHANSSFAAVIVAMNSFGTMLFDLPSGRIVARLGERRSSALAFLLLVIGLVGCLFSPNALTLAASVLVQAAGWAVWSLVRLTHLSRVAPPLARGRALSLFGGVIRAGNVIGPFLYLATARQRSVSIAFVLYLICVAIGFVWIAIARDKTDEVASTTRAEHVRPLKVLAGHRRDFLTTGVGAFGVSLLRGSRNAIVPLWAAHLGLSAWNAAEIFAFSSLIDLALFYPAGVASDRFGRRAVALPCLLLLSIGHILIPFSHSFYELFFVAFVLGVGNGCGAGIVMTMGADLTPEVGRASFLAVWRLISDTGTTAGPLVDSAVVAIGSIAFAGPVIGVLGIMSGLVIALFMKEPGPLASSVPATSS